MKYFSTFTGVGGFELGIEYALDNRHETKGRAEMVSGRKPDNSSVDVQGAATCIGFSEIDKYASAVLKYHYPDIKNYGDITKIDWSTVPDFDLLTGGSPCQDLSIAGKRSGLSGERSGLFFEYMRAVREKRPKYFIWENVKGALSSNRGFDFGTVINEMAEAGYSLWWQVLNARDFGVPQNRERVFVVGTRNGSPREVFFERGADAKGLVEITQNAPDAERVYDPKGIGRTLKGLGGGEGAKTMLIRCPLRFLNRNQKEIEGDYAFTVDASNTAGMTDGSRVRRLTPTECERLMSWPDDWTRYGLEMGGRNCKAEETDTLCQGHRFEISDSQRYKMCGNGVVSEVVKNIIKEFFYEHKTES